MVHSRHSVRLGAWKLGSCAPGASPDRFQDVVRAQTVAGAWAEWGELDVDDRSTLGRIDNQEHWWRTCLPGELSRVGEQGHRLVLECPGIATIAEIFINGEKVADSVSMFVPIRVDITAFLTGNDELLIIIRSLTAYLESRKWDRPRWKTRLVSDQRLRNVRTAVIGRVGWAPPTPVAGPYGGVVAHVFDRSEIRSCTILAELDGDDGSVSIDVLAGANVDVSFELGSTVSKLDPDSVAENSTRRWRSVISVPHTAKWFPATHGSPALMAANLILTDSDGTTWKVPHTAIGFRKIAVDESDGGFAVRVNDVPVFCRGAVAFPFDLLHGVAEETTIRKVLRQAVESGFNMLRVGGTGWYEQPEFHALCDELGLLVWHDLPFASLDYPSTAEFQQLVQSELSAHLSQIVGHVSTAVICGSSEVEQQAAMMGVSPAVIATTPGRTWINKMVASIAPAVPYVSSSPTGGHLPMRVDTGLSHYFGVGAYQRPLSDATTSGVRFASECLAFANIPSAMVARELGEIGGEKWKRRVPKDSGSDWDFDDVRDHYVGVLAGQTAALRTTNSQRWSEIAELIPGEVMADTFRQWRSSSGRCAGGLVLSLNDVWPSAGWGLFDSDGVKKSSLDRLSQVLAPVAVLPMDRGLNGLDLYLVNDSPELVEGFLTVRAMDDRGRTVLRGVRPVRLEPRSTSIVSSEEALGRFADPTYSYHFGNRPFEAVAAVLSPRFPSDGLEDLDQALASGLYVVEPDWSHVSSNGLRVADVVAHANFVKVTIDAEELHRFVRVDIEGMEPDIRCFDLAPGQRRSVTLTSQPGNEPSAVGTLQSLSLENEIRFHVAGAPRDR